MGQSVFRAIARRSVDGGKGGDSRGSGGKRTSRKASGDQRRNEGGGKFQKASVDEAYLEPTRRTLMAELLLSQQERNGHNAPAGCSSASAEVGAAPPAASKLPLAGVKRPRGGDSGAFGGGPLPAEPAQRWRYCDDNGSTRTFSRYGGRPNGSQDGGSSGEGNGWDMMAGWNSLDNDGQPGEWARRTTGNLSRTKQHEEDEEDRFLEAGGLLGRRIQRALSEVLKYDCSVGVAGNKVRKLNYSCVL